MARYLKNVDEALDVQESALDLARSPIEDHPPNCDCRAVNGLAETIASAEPLANVVSLAEYRTKP